MMLSTPSTALASQLDWPLAALLTALVLIGGSTLARVCAGRRRGSTDSASAIPGCASSSRRARPPAISL